MARSIRIVCTISPRRGAPSPRPERSGQAKPAAGRPAEADPAEGARGLGTIIDLAAVKRAKGLSSA
jgi:hypothetical protein